MSEDTKPLLGIISFSYLQKDARLLKQINYFSADYRVITCGYGEATVGVFRHFRLDDNWVAWKYRRSQVMLRQYRQAYWSNQAVAGARGLLAAEIFDAIIANDIDAVPLALSLRSRHGVHADLHEYAPGEKENLLRWRLFVKPFRKWICRTYLPQCGSVTTVARGIARKYQSEFGQNVEVVMNASPFADLRPTAVSAPLRLVHSGVSHRDRSLELMIDAVEAAEADMVLDLYLTDSDPENLAALRDRAARTTGVRVLDAVPYQNLIATLNQYDLGVFVLPPVSFNYRYALPNKLFDYLQARLGIVIGPSPEMTELVDSVGNGTVCADFTAQALADTLDQVDISDVETWKQASHAAADRLNAEQENQRWGTAVASLMRKPSES